MEKVFSSVIWKLLERCSVQIASIIIQIVLARILAPNDFGVLAILVIFVNLADVFIRTGFVSSIIRKQDATDEDYSTAFLVSEIIAFSLYVILFLVSPLIEEAYDLSGLAQYLRVISISLFFGAAYSIENTILIKKMNFRAIFLCGIVATIVSGVAGITCAMLGMGVWSLVIQNVTQKVILCFVTHTLTKWHSRLVLSRTSLREIFQFGSKVLISEIVYVLIEDTRTLVIGKRFSTNELAYYDRGQVYPSSMIRGVYDTISSVFLPVFSTQQEDKNLLSKSVTKVLRITMFFVFPICVGLAAVSKPFTFVLLTEKWSASIPYLQVFCIYQAAIPPYGVLRQALYAIGKSTGVLILEIIKGAAFVVAILIGIAFNPFVVALGTTVAMFFSLICYMVYAFYVIRFDAIKILSTFIKTSVSCLIMYAAVQAINMLPLPWIVLLVVDVLLGAMVYIVMCLVLKEHSIKEAFEYVKVFLRRK